MQRLEDHAESLNDALESADDGQLDALKAVLEKAEAEVRQHESSLEDGKSAVAGVMEKLKNLRKDLKEKSQDLVTLLQNCSVAKEELEHVANKRHRILSQKNGAIARIEDDRRNREMVREKRDQLAAQILEHIEQASLIAARVPVDEGETPHSLSQKLEKSEQDLQRYSAQYVYPPQINLKTKLISGFLAGWVLQERKLLTRLLQRRPSINTRRDRWKRWKH